MAVKRSQSAIRVLRVFETIARMQPVGLAALARALGADKSATQRDLMTLADAGWIKPVSGDSRNWELSHQIMTLARQPHTSDLLRRQIRPVLERLQLLTDETVYLTVPHQRRFVVIEAIESPHLLRVVPPVGIVVPLHGSATARAYLAHLPAAEQEALLGAPTSPELLAELVRVRESGYAVNDGEIVPGSVTFAAPLIGAGARPIGTLVVTGPSDRIQRDRWPEIGGHLRDASRLAASQLSPRPSHAELGAMLAN